MRTPRSWAGLAAVIAAAAIAGAFVACSDFTPPGAAGSSSLSVSPKTAHLNVGNSLQLNATGSSGAIVWSSSDAAVATVSLGRVMGVGSGSATIRAVSGTDQATARITVTRAAAIAVSNNNFSFNAIPSGPVPDSQTANITNAGEDSLTGLQVGAIVYDAGASGWLTARVTQTSAPATLVLRPNTTVLAPGSYTATVTISSPVASSSQIVSVRFTLVRPAGIAVGSSGAVFNVQQGSAIPAQQSISITNAGDAPLTGLAVGPIAYSSGATNWLDANVTPSVAPASLILRPNTSALTPGDYSATVPVTSTVAGVTPASVTVTYHVTAAPTPATIVLSRNATSFSAVIGDPLPTQTSVDVTDGGQQPLTGLTVTTSYAAGQPSNWLLVNAGGTSAPMTITLQPNTTGLAAGTYNATVTVASQVAANQSVTLTVTYTLIRPASIVLGSSTATFSAQQATSLPSQQSIAITNGGDAPLTGLAIGNIGYSSGATGWLNAAVSPSTAPASLLLQPNATNLPVGDYTATVPVTSSVAGVAPATLTVTYHVAAAPTPPVIVLSRSTLTFSGTSGEATLPAQQTLNVTNGGQVALTNVSVSTTYTNGQPANWLSVTPSGTTAPFSVNVQPNTTGLTAGTYTATISIASSVATNSPQTVSVTYTLIRPASIVLGSTTASFTAQQNATAPAQQSISVTNGGDAPLTGLAIGAITYAAGASNWLVASVSPSTAPASLLLQPNTTGLAAGDYTATVPVTSSVAGVASQNVTVTYHVTAPPPVIVVNPTSLTFTAGRNFGTLPSTQQISITSSGTGTISGLSAASITYAAGATNWLSTSFVAGLTTAPTTLNVQPNTTGLAAGVYSATIHLSSTTSGVVTKDIPITYIVNDLVLSQSTVTLTTTASTPTPTVPVINVSNGGSGTISGVSASVTQTSGRADNTYTWLSASIATTVPQSPGTSLSITILRADSLGTFTGQVTVSAPGLVSKTVTVTLTRQATLNGDILSIVKTCASSCHSTGSTTNFFVSFADVDTAYKSLVTPTNGHTYIVTGDSAASNLYKILNGTPPAGYFTMPSSACATDATKCLDSQLRTRIYIWIMQGALKQ